MHAVRARSSGAYRLKFFPATKNSRNLSSRPAVKKCFDTFRVKKNLRLIPAHCTTAWSFHTGCVSWLKLADGDAHEDWEREYWLRYTEEKKEKKRAGIMRFSMGILHDTRDMHLVLVKDGSNFQLQDDFETMCRDLESHPDIIASSYPLHIGRKGVVIENRYLTVDEWNSSVEDFIVDGRSKSAAFTYLMEFALLANQQCIKVDKTVDYTQHISGPLVNSLLDFIFSSQDNITHCQRALTIYLPLCIHLNFIDLFEKVYRRAKENIKVFGADLMRACLKKLKYTKYWRDVYDYNKILRDLGKKYDENETVLTALANGDLETGVKAFGNLFKTEGEIPIQPQISESCIIGMLKAFRYNDDPAIWRRNREIIEVMFSMMNYNHIFPTNQDTVQAIVDWFKDIKDEKWEHAYVENSIIRGRQCPFTKVELDSKELSDEDYDHLSEVIFKHIVMETMVVFDPAHTLYDIPGDTYTGTTNSEIKSFLKMLHHNGPFDLVVDGMNALYYMKSNKVTSNDVVRMCDLFVRSTVKSGEKRKLRKFNTLITFKSHIKPFIHDEFKDYAHVWFSSSDSRDDPYFLYAAILSGRRCDLVTLDLMRNIKYSLLAKIDFKDAYLLHKWQQIHQNISAHAKGAQKFRQRFDISIQRTDKTWHFPYSMSPLQTRTQPLPNEWLCLQRTG